MTILFISAVSKRKRSEPVVAATPRRRKCRRRPRRPDRSASIVGRRKLAARAPRTLPATMASPLQRAGRGSDHVFSSKSLSRITGNCSGSVRYRESTSSRNFSSLGRGVGSFKILFHAASPSNSGTSVGSESASCARSVSESWRMAAWISSTVLTPDQYNGGRFPARLAR